MSGDNWEIQRNRNRFRNKKCNKKLANGTGKSYQRDNNHVSNKKRITKKYIEYNYRIGNLLKV